MVTGSVAPPMHPTHGLPQGDPCAGASLDSVLKPWERLIQQHCPSIGTWSFVDDRLLASISADAQPDSLQQALTLTADFDSSIGLQENISKRQRWPPADTIEHLGLVTKPLSPNFGIVGRNKWDKAPAIIQLLRTLPGTAPVKERLAMAFVNPQFQWAAPFLAAPAMATS